MSNTTTTPSRGEILSLLRQFIHQRPGFEWGNYAPHRDAYRADYNRALRDLHDAGGLLAEIAFRDSIDAKKILYVLTSGGRLEWSGKGLEYTAGQYFPTEYRAATCQVLATILWNYFRDDCEAKSPSEYAMKHIRNKSLARRWFN